MWCWRPLSPLAVGSRTRVWSARGCILPAWVLLALPLLCLSQFGWCHGSGQQKGLGFFPGWKFKEFLKLWRWQLSPSGWPQRPVVPHWTCSPLPIPEISPHIPPFATWKSGWATGTASPGSPRGWGWCEAVAPLPLPHVDPCGPAVPAAGR